jgi:hypothetical protein
LPNRDRNRSRHEIILRDVGQDQSTAPMIIRTAVAAKPNVGINGKRLCRVTVLRTLGVRSTSPQGLMKISTTLWECPELPYGANPG